MPEPRQCRRREPGTGRRSRSPTAAESAARHARPASSNWAPEKFAAGSCEQKRLLLTDTTFRDAHQSLLATRMRTYDMLQIADALCASGMPSCSRWRCGAGPRSTRPCASSRNPPGSGWPSCASGSQHPVPDAAAGRQRRRLHQLSRQRRQGVRQGIGRRPASTCSASSIRSTGCRTCSWRSRRCATPGMLCEAAICYTGDILDPKRTKYDLKYYVDLAKELEKLGANLLAIKDMAGLCKPYAAELLVETLQAGNRHPDPLPHARHEPAARSRRCSWPPRRAWTSSTRHGAAVGHDQPAESERAGRGLRFTPRDTGLDFDALQDDGRLLGRRCAQFYAPFETGLTGQHGRRLSQRNARRPVHEPVSAGPGARAGRPLARDLPDVRRGQPAVRRHRQGDAVVEGGRRHGPVHGRQQSDAERRARTASASWRFPNRWSSSSRAGWASRRAVSRRSCSSACCAAGSRCTDRPGASLPPADFAATRAELRSKLVARPVNDRELLTLSALSARLHRFRRRIRRSIRDTSVLPTPVFFYGMEPGEEVSVDIEHGQDADHQVPDRRRSASRRPADWCSSSSTASRARCWCVDRSLAGEVQRGPRRSRATRKHVGAPMPGLVVRVAGRGRRTGARPGRSCSRWKR